MADWLVASAGIGVAGARRRLGSTSPTWYAQNERAREAVTVASFWRSDPAAELRGLTNSLSPASAWRRLRSSKAGDRHVDLAPHLEDLGQRSDGRVEASGMAAMVAMLAVTSSPVVPSPRVAAWTNRPSR